MIEPSGRLELVVISGFPIVTAIVNSFEALPFEFVALSVKVKVPAFVGVPLILPSCERVSPSGSLPLVML